MTAAYSRRNLELRAAEFYLTLRKPESQWLTIYDLTPQLAEFEHRMRAEDFEGAYKVLELIDSRYLDAWGYYARLAELRERLLNRPMLPELDADNMSSLGNVYLVLGKTQRAIALHTDALSAVKNTGDRVRQGRYLGYLGNAQRAIGQDQQAITLYENALAIAREVEDRRAEGVWVSLLGGCYRDLGRYEQAIALYSEALTIARETDDLWNEARCLSRLGIVYRSKGQFGRGIEFHEEALDIARRLNNRQEVGIQLCNLSDSYYSLHQLNRAENLCREALAIARDIGYSAGEERYLSRLGNANFALRHYDLAQDYFEQALAIAREIGDRRGESYQLIGLGKSLLAVGKTSAARGRCEEAVHLEIPQTAYQAALLLGIALLHNRDVGARRVFTDAVERCTARLEQTATLYEVRFALAAAVTGEGVTDPRWGIESGREVLLERAVEEYRLAIAMCDAPVIIRDALIDLEMIRAAGVDVLEPIFDLLRSKI